jgi:molecular chaperone HtpG
MEIEIGKFTLESLTSGMYSEPESCYREYIQNSVDSLDCALAEDLMRAEDFRIEIIVDDSRQEITISDNGAGIKKDLVRKTLLDIGNSTKSHTKNRGFRGIGRLGGLSYCKKLSFCTTAFGENEKTVGSRAKHGAQSKECHRSSYRSQSYARTAIRALFHC